VTVIHYARTDGPAVRAYAAEVKPSTMLKVLHEHYFKHPLAQIDQKHDGNAALRKVTLDIELDTSEDDWEDLEA